MKINLFRTLSVLCLLAGPLSLAQTRPASPPATTGRPATGSTDTSPRRQQDLYDQYNNANKKPASSTTPSSPASGRFGSTTSSGSAVDQPTKASSDGNTSAFRVGIRGGVTKAFFTEKRPLVESAVSFVGGLVFQLGAGAVSFQPEVNYARSSFNTLAGPLKLTSSVDYIQVPLFLKIAVGPADGTRVFLNIGPYGAYAYSATVAGSKFSLDGTDGRISYGGAAGVGVMVKAGPGQVTLEGRGYYQLGDNAKPSTGDQKTIFGQAAIGYMFPLGGR